MSHPDFWTSNLVPKNVTYTRVNTLHVYIVNREGSVAFRLEVRTTKPLKRAEIEEVSVLLKHGIETYGPLEIGGQEVALKGSPEVHPSERMTALGMATLDGFNLTLTSLINDNLFS
jgi:hypothetical protein